MHQAYSKDSSLFNTYVFLNGETEGTGSLPEDINVGSEVQVTWMNGPRVVGLVASPRRGMNTDTIVSKMLEGAETAGASVENVYVNDLVIRPCQACGKSPKPDFCFYHDGMDTIYSVINSADAVIVGTPAYYDTISAQLKLVIDRCNCLTEMLTLPDGRVAFKSRVTKRKKGIFVWVADFSRNPEPALAAIRLWCKDALIDLVDVFEVTDSDRGEGARNRADVLQKAFETGAKLARSI